MRSQRANARVMNGVASNTGFSLVEMMIALALGTVIVLGAIGLFITNQRTFQLQQGLTDVQQQGGFTQDFMANDLRQIGYAPDGATGSVAFGIAFAQITVNGVTLPASSNGAGTTSDVLTFTFTGTQDCGGTSNATEVQIAESYSVDANGNLQCLGSLSKAAVTLLSGVPSMQVLYGVDNVKNKLATVASYVTADKVSGLTNDKGDAAQVVAVRVGFLVEQASGNPDNVSSNRSYMLLDKKLTDGTAPLAAKNMVRREFITTVPVRNYDWKTL